jgi:hypothetical protein
MNPQLSMTMAYTRYQDLLDAAAASRRSADISTRPSLTARLRQAVATRLHREPAASPARTAAAAAGV